MAVKIPFFSKKKDTNNLKYKDFPHLLELKPREQYIFHSDYFEVDDSYGCILSFFHSEGAPDNFAAFWGINLIPAGMPEGVVTILLEQNRRMSEKWIEAHQSKSENIADMNVKEQSQNGTNTTAGKSYKKATDLQIIAQELINGAAYMHVQYRLMIKAPTLESLDDARKKLDRLYIDRFVTLNAAPYIGQQRKELTTLFKKNDRKEGKGFHFTSAEYAGTYNLVTHGMEDPAGEYVGQMTGDVNMSAVLFDVNNYEHHIVVANDHYNENYKRAHVADMWGSKISQSCLMRNGRVVHIILDGANLDNLGPKFEGLTYKIDMTKGDVNMFEMFGEEKDELAIFSAQMLKLRLMAEQAYETNEHDRAIIRGSLEEIATRFYIDSRMWYDNAAMNREKLRVINIPHNEVPKLEKFAAYMDTEYKSAIMAQGQDGEYTHAMNVLKTTFRNMLTSNGDLFNTTTSDKIDGAKTGRRVIYDFSELMRRGVNIAMAQLVNIIGFAIGNLKRGDVVILHGAENIDGSVKEYINQQFDQLYAKGGRVAFLYNNTDKMLADQEFCEFDKADYTIMGSMTENTIAQYQKQLGQEIPPDLSRLITNKSNQLCYIRRDFDNVVFRMELTLGTKNERWVR